MLNLLPFDVSIVYMKKLLYILPVVLLMAACSSHQYHTTRVVNQDFKQYKTYGWLTPIDSESKNYFNNDIARANIMETANQELEARGLTYTKDNPDLLFRYIAIVNNTSRPVYGHYPMYGGWGWYNPWVYHYRHHPIGRERYRAGHIIIEARDRVSDTVIWQARGSGRVNNPESAINNLPKVVHGVFNEYPVGVLKN